MMLSCIVLGGGQGPSPAIIGCLAGMRELGGKELQFCGQR